MTSFVLSPQMREMIIKAKTTGAAVQCDPRRMYPVGHQCSTRVKTGEVPTGKITPPWIDAGGVPVPDEARIVRETRTPTGGAVVQIETANGDSVEATTAANGAVQKVEVKEMKWLMPAAIAAAAFVLLGG